MKKLLFLSLCCAFLSITAQKADLIIFSFDRPLQLYALLESADRYIHNIGDIHVIYRSSDARYDRAYQEVFQNFSNVVSIKQGANPKADFKPLVLKSFLETPHEYILFAVDDIIIQDTIDITQCIKTMEKTNAYGFYLRLGKNITYCYMLNKAQRVPSLQEVENGMYAWIFSEAQYDWAYPHTVDMTIYRKKDIEHDLRSMEYQAPNSLEGTWCGSSRRIIGRKGLCYAHSKMVNLPLNRVQSEVVYNRNENSLSVLELLNLFERGLKIDIDLLHKINNTSPHMAYSPSFISKNT